MSEKKNSYDPKQHLRYFSEFCRYVELAGGATPHLKMAVAAAEGLPLADRLWRGGCYAALYNYPGAEAVWQQWEPGEAVRRSDKFADWIKQNWAGLPLRRERKAVNNPLRLTVCLISFARWMERFDSYRFIATGDYEDAWRSFTTVDYMGRYIAIRFLEFLRRSLGLHLVMPDIRPRDAIYPRQSLSLFYPEHKKELMGGNSAYEIDIANRASGALLESLQAKDVIVDYYTLQSLLCEYKQSVLGGRQYPGRSVDSELIYWAKTFGHFDSLAPRSQMWEIRERIFPAYSLGEKQGWPGARNDLGRVLIDYGYTWSDAIFDYKQTRHLSSPVKRAQ